MHKDPSGYFLETAIEMLKTWLYGNGESQTYKEGSNFVEAVKESTKMDKIIKTAVRDYIDTGDWFCDGTVNFNTDDGLDLYLSTHSASYEITVSEVTRNISFSIGGYNINIKETWYIASVKISDLYNFDMKKWESAGNILNNLAAVAHNNIGIGTDYYWTAEYSVKYKEYDVEIKKEPKWNYIV